MLQFITNATTHEAIVEQVMQVLSGGCKWIQLRMKGADSSTVAHTAQALKPLCKEHEAILIVDDEVEVAKELELDGVHLGKNDMDTLKARELLGAEPIIGATANTFDDIDHLPRVAIDYVGLGPFRYTTTKQNLSPVIGLDGYRNIMDKCRHSDIEHPIVAIGGITLADVEPIMATGVHGIAVCGAIANAPDPAEATRQMVELLNKITEKRLDGFSL